VGSSGVCELSRGARVKAVGGALIQLLARKGVGDDVWPDWGNIEFRLKQRFRRLDIIRGNYGISH